MSDQWETLEDLFKQACNMEPEEQAAFLETLPASQREALAKLLRHDKEDTRSALDSVAQAAWARYTSRSAKRISISRSP